MDKNLLEKHKNDPTWAEVVRLYSGLFDTQDEREGFILNLAETDILLAAECKSASTHNQEKLQQTLSEKATTLLKTENTNHLPVFSALYELNRLDLVASFISNIKRKEIPSIRELLKKLPRTIEAKKILLTAVNSQPTFFIYTLLEVIEEFEKEGVYLTNENINFIFDGLIKGPVKPIRILSFLKKFANKIDNITRYSDYAIQFIYDITGYNNLVTWIKLFNIDISTEVLIKKFCNSPSIKVLHNVIFLLESLSKDKQISMLNNMLQSGNNKLITTGLIYLCSHYPIRNKFKNVMYRYNLMKLHEPTDRYSDFYKFFIRISKRVAIDIALENNAISHLKIGDVVNCKLISKRLKYYLLKNSGSNATENPMSYILPIPEAINITESDILNKKKVRSKIIHIDENQKKIFLSMVQLNKGNNEIVFNENYLNEVNVGDIMLCNIGLRLKDKIYVKINGMSKNVKGIILGDIKLFEGVTKLKAKVIEVKNETIYLNAVEFIKNEDIEFSRINYTSLTVLKENNEIGNAQKILILVNERFTDDVDFTIGDFHPKIAYVTRQPLASLFPTKQWLINFLERNEYISKSIEKNTFKFVKPLTCESFEKMNIELECQGWKTISSFNKEELKTLERISKLSE